MSVKKPVVAVEPLSPLIIEPAVKAALLEDFGHGGDLTTEATIPPTATAHGVIAAREGGRIAGLDLAVTAFRLLSPAIKVTIETPDGANVARGDVLATIQGPARPILSAERVALNYLGRL